MSNEQRGTSSEPCREWRERLGPFALGHGDPAERAAIQAHVDGCPACAAEVASLTPVANALLLADPEHIASPQAVPRDLGDRVAARVAAERRGTRRRTRRRFALALSGAAASIALIAVGALSLLGSSGAGTEQVNFGRLPDGVELGATLTSRPFGSEIRVHVVGVQPGTMCRVSLTRADGSRVPAGSFRYLYDGNSNEAVLTSALKPADARTITVQAGPKSFTAPIPKQEESAS